MEQQLDLGKCYYKPSFFNMKIDLPIELDNLNDIPVGAMGLYYHEYIHFIQDISTIYGLMNISTINYYIQSCAHYIEKNKNIKEFDVPIELEKIIDRNIENDKGLLNFYLRPIYIGSSIKVKSKYISDFNYYFEPFEFDKDKFIDKVMISFTDVETKLKKEFCFGGNHITEGMAYLCEQYNYSDILPKADEYPYLIVQKIIEKDYPEIINDKILIIALCDISLMTYHPAYNFIKLVKFIKQIDIEKNNYSIEEIYSLCHSHIKGNHVDFSILVENIKIEIKRNFNAIYFNDITDWIDIIFDRIKIFRTEIPSFIIDLVYHGKPTENSFFIKFHTSMGSPLVLNADDFGTISLPFNFNPTTNNYNPGIFLAISQVLKIFYQSKPTSCDLKEYCLKSKSQDPNLNVDAKCDTSPWEKAREKDLCPVGQIWHHWALKDFSPKFKN